MMCQKGSKERICLRLYTASTKPKTRKVKNEKSRLKLLDVRDVLPASAFDMCRGRPSVWCQRISFGSFISLMKKSDMSEIFIRVEMCRSILERIKSMAVRLNKEHHFCQQH